MNSEHLQDLRWPRTGGSGGAIAGKDDLDHVLTSAWAVGMVLAAYDHELFHPWRPGQESTWSATLRELLGARNGILAEIIPSRLRSYRSGSSPVAPAHVS
jgi:hypothetical protein